MTTIFQLPSTVYYGQRRQAPYLMEIVPSSQQTQRQQNKNKNKKPDSLQQQEADAAAGGSVAVVTNTVVNSFSRRVSSLGLLPRVASSDAVQVLRNAVVGRSTTIMGGGGSGGGDPSGSAATAAGAVPPPPSLPPPQPFGPSSLSSSLPLGGPLEQDSLNYFLKESLPAPSWRLRDRMKTVGIGLVMALNIGTDPPDLVKPSPCAVLETWINPQTVSRAKAKEIIGERLEQQYAKWQLARSARPLKYRRATDPTVEDVRTICVQLRRQARNERVLLHYNGRGVPRPTSNGEIWVFDKNHTEYIPLSVLDLRQWLGRPSIVVLDCSAAGILLPSFRAPWGTPGEDGVATSTTMDELSSQWVNDTIVLCPCAENEWLPMSPDYPADIFTSCLTTPIQIALRWFVRNHPTSMKHVHADAVDLIPGKANDRKTPLGELNWIFTAVTDSIAWNSLPKPLFQRLFRQDLLVASMFRNFLLADRILRSLGCTPMSHPPLPPGMSAHPLWRAWDLACETLLFQLRDSILLPSSVHLSSSSNLLNPNNSSNPEDESAEGAEPLVSASAGAAAAPSVLPQEAVDPSTVTTTSSPFFSEQLTAFEVWLEYAEIHRVGLEPPEQLPVVLQVLLSQVHRVRALLLLRRFLQLGPWAVDLSLSLGIFPYVMKLLQSPEYKSLLVSIWASILAFDPSTRADLLKDGAYHHFVQHLLWGLDHPSATPTSPSKMGLDDSMRITEAAEERTIAAFVLAAAAHEYPPGQAECMKLQLHGNCCALLSSYEQGENAHDEVVEWHFPPHFRLWLCLCLGNLVKLNSATQAEAYNAGVHSRLVARLQDCNAEVRASVCYALGCMVGAPPNRSSRASSTQDLPAHLQQQQAQAFVQGAANFAVSGTPGGLMPQRVAGLPSNMVVPGQFTLPGAGVPNLHWRPQHMEATFTASTASDATSLTSPTLSQDRQPLVSGMVPFGNQPVNLRPVPQPSGQQHYLLHGQQPIGHSSMESIGAAIPSTFMLGGSQMISPQFHMQPSMQPEPPRPLRPTVYEDRRRLELDLSVMDAIGTCVADSSVLVRYETVMGLAVVVGKYLDAFIVAADESSAALSSPSHSATTPFPYPRGLDRRIVPRFAEAWRKLRLLQHHDPFPAVAKVASRVVRFVNEHLLAYRMEVDDSIKRTTDGSQSNQPANLLSGIEEDVPTTPTTTQSRNPDERIRAQTTGRLHSKQELRRVLSEVTTKDEAASMEESILASASSTTPPNRMLSSELPKSLFYEWKKRSFDPTFTPEDCDPSDLDLLSPIGAAKAYQQRRNLGAQKKGLELAARFSCLAPRPPKPERKSIQMILEEDDEETGDANEEESAQKKSELKMQESLILRNEGVQMTSMLQFHSFEDVLVSCGGRGTVSVWDTKKSGERLAFFDNGNPESTRMTTSGWINEESSSLFFVGCDDGTIRVWGGLVQNTGELCDSPFLRSAYEAVSMKAGQRGSGLVCEWQPFSGMMLAGGNAKVVNGWDLQAERQVCQIGTNTDANVTTLTTAWDFDQLGMGVAPQGNQCFGRDIFVSGHSDGSLKIFDLRTHCKSAGVNLVESPPSRRPRHKPTSFTEHTSWVVTTAFTGHASRFELVSGTVAGEVKAWDLRMSGSVRTLDVQRSTMTALAFHSKVPLLASGSHAQFIKLVNLDGDTLQVLRYHEKMANHRIGPVSCLAFHRYKAILAAGSTDSFIGIYTPRKS